MRPRKYWPALVRNPLRLRLGVKSVFGDEITEEQVTSDESGNGFVYLIEASDSRMLSFSAIPLLPNYPVIVMGDDPEIVGDDVGDHFPFLWKGFIEESEDRLGELAEIRMEPVVRHMAVHDAP